MEVSSSVDAVVITAAIVGSALIYIWVIKNGANILKLRIVLLGAKPREAYSTEFHFLHYPLITVFLNKMKKTTNHIILLQLELLRFLQREASPDHPKGREMAREILSL